MDTETKKSIILIGCMGAGKSSVGQCLAHTLHIDYTDSDLVIEAQADMTITKIFETYGEAHFRELEHNALRCILAMERRQVIAAGGGLPLMELNRLAIKAKAESLSCVYLTADADTLFARVKNDDKRPLLKKSDPKAELIKILAARDPIYRQCADVVVKTDHMKIEDIVSEILCKIF